jgi:hypothetical protein
LQKVDVELGRRLRKFHGAAPAWNDVLPVVVNELAVAALYYLSWMTTSITAQPVHDIVAWLWYMPANLHLVVVAHRPPLPLARLRPRRVTELPV